LAYIEEPVKILDRMKQTLWNKIIPFVKVLEKHNQTTDATWEPERMMREKYPTLFESSSQILGTKFLFRAENVRAMLF